MIEQATPGHRSPATRRERSAGIALGTLTVCLAVPYLIAGPGWFREDFASLANVRFRHALDAAGPVVGRNRPVTAAIYGVVFGWLGDHPVIIVLIITALLAAAAILTHALLRISFSAGPAAASAAIFLLTPALRRRRSMLDRRLITERRPPRA